MKDNACTAGQFRRNERRIERNAKVVVDNFGTVYRITRSRRILSVQSPTSGQWESPKRTDGVRRAGSPYVYVDAATHLQPWRVLA